MNLWYTCFMCATFKILLKDAEEIMTILKGIDKRKQAEQLSFLPLNASSTERAFFPKALAPVLTAEAGNSASYFSMTWGFPKKSDNAVIFNVRSETVEEKFMFKNSFISSRCLVPASGFFEWDNSLKKQKFFFTNEKNTLMYLAGIYSVFNNEKRFSILTTNANSSVSAIHSRMPIIVEKDNISSFLFNYDYAKEYVKTIQPPLKKAAQ